MIRTARLLLRQWRDEDLEPFARLNADPEVMRHFPATLDRSTSDAVADRIRKHIDEHGWGLWAVEVLDGARQGFAGFPGLARPRFDAHFTPAVEVGWRLRRGVWGNGYATEAAEAALAFGFRELGLEEIVSFTATGNIRSIAVMKRLGMHTDPAEDFDHPALVEGSPLRRHVLYRLPRTVWESEGRGRMGT